MVKVAAGSNDVEDREKAKSDSHNLLYFPG